MNDVVAVAGDAAAADEDLRVFSDAPYDVHVAPLAAALLDECRRARLPMLAKFGWQRVVGEHALGTPAEHGVRVVSLLDTDGSAAHVLGPCPPRLRVADALARHGRTLGPWLGLVDGLETLASDGAAWYRALPAFGRSVTLGPLPSSSTAAPPPRADPQGDPTSAADDDASAADDDANAAVDRIARHLALLEAACRRNNVIFFAIVYTVAAQEMVGWTLRAHLCCANAANPALPADDDVYEGFAVPAYVALQASKVPFCRADVVAHLGSQMGALAQRRVM